MKKLTREEVLGIVREFQRELAALYGDRLKGVYLYGSYARGDARWDSDIDARWDSDIDVAVVLDGPVRQREESRRASETIGDISLRHNCVLMPVFLSVEELRRRPYAVHRSIASEGVPI